MDVLKFIGEHKIVAIARRIDTERLVDAVAAMREGGVKTFEITFDQASSSLETTARSIALLKERYGDTVALGAGTVLNTDQLNAAADSGAQFILAPNTNVSLIEAAKKRGLVAIPGAFTPSEIVTAWEAGADIVKLFPAATFGIPYLKAIRGPINHIPLMAVGGIDETNIKVFLENGCMSGGIGSNLFRADLINGGKWDELSNLSRMFVEAAL
ncbi:MAG: bifunctional 4-hydroxy-2-oxoglutarate aldolase/2-dehydro-3-deoxy-phosphogluconate aldolase [Sphaerochaeta sp.]|nr:bifunctional 4-hydroxy-2-oxoglutarate aldolase/2-dehydro-3-deoxy-phosphogluconate aldolase [Sphaerochaeta sp.]